MEEANKFEETSRTINAFIEEYQGYFFVDRNQKLKPEIDRHIKELDSLSETISNNAGDADESKKQPRAQVFLMKARLLDMLPEYEKSAEEFLNKSVADRAIQIKLNPVSGDCWNTLGHVLWKKKDL